MGRKGRDCWPEGSCAASTRTMLSIAVLVLISFAMLATHASEKLSTATTNSLSVEEDAT
jgi:hypothetical protein